MKYLIIAASLLAAPFAHAAEWQSMDSKCQAAAIAHFGERTVLITDMNAFAHSCMHSDETEAAIKRVIKR